MSTVTILGLTGSAVCCHVTYMVLLHVNLPLLLLLPPLLQLQAGDSDSWHRPHSRLSNKLNMLVVFMLRHQQQVLPAMPALPKGFRHQELQAAVHALGDNAWQVVSWQGHPV